MSVGVRRWLAFFGGCVAGLGLGGLVRSAVPWYGHNPADYGTYAVPDLWIAGLVVGAGLGMAIAATIRQ
jgi:hypothetical protein